MPDVSDLPEGHEEATRWFEVLYASAADSEVGVPWARFRPAPGLLSWAAKSRRDAEKTALVVGCGLGDDAEALAEMGYDVTAFDIAPSAIEWAEERFPDSPVTYQVADLFMPPSEWRHGFDFVFESRTIQSLPPEIQREATMRVANLVAEGGRLLIFALACEPGTPVGGPPWPISRDVFDAADDVGLERLRFDREGLSVGAQVYQIQGLWKRQ